MGSSLPNYEEKTFSISDHQVIYNGNISTPNRIGTKDKIVEDALMYLNAPYLWGGRSPFGIDCSGLTQIVYKVNNVVIPRDASQQAELGVGYSFLEEAEAGDIAFFDNEEGKINHVGILIDKNRIIHASGKVRIDALDHQGIFNKETKNDFCSVSNLKFYLLNGLFNKNLECVSNINQFFLRSFFYDFF